MRNAVSKPAIAVGTSVVFALSLSACGGGNSEGVSSTPPPPTPAVVVPPPPPPPPSPPPVTPPPPPNMTINTAEYRRSDGPAFHYAATAYQADATGRGVTVGVIDSGIDVASHEFAGRIHANSGDVTSAGRPLGDDDGHGTAVARILAAAKDDQDIHGIAYDATILALRADTAGSCRLNESGCSFNDMAIANGVNQAVDAGARVINISLSGGGGASAALRNAISRAAAAGIVIVVAAGNEGNRSGVSDPTNPTLFAQAILASGGGNVIIATSVGDDGLISGFSNHAGQSGASVLSALGDGVCCEYKNDAIKTENSNGQNFVTVYNGTSFSAPQIAGAAALLAQAFPNLTGSQIVSLLLSSAKDAGVAGTDIVYGRGILDISRAFAPAGTLTLAGTTSVVSMTDSGNNLSGPMGDAGSSGAAVDAVILDSYGRAYELDLTGGTTAASPRSKLGPVLIDDSRSASIAVGKAELAFSVASSRGGNVALHALSLSNTNETRARILAGRISAQIASDTRFSFGIRQSAAAQLAALRIIPGSNFIAAKGAAFDNGFDRRSATAFALRHDIHGWGLTASIENGNVNFYERNSFISSANSADRYPFVSLGLTGDGWLGPVKATAGLQWLDEKETVLGARFAGIFGTGGASTLFADAGIHGDIANNWSLSANWRQGWTRPDATTGVAHGALITSNGFSADLTGQGLFVDGDRVGLRIAQPLRVTSGSLNLNLPVAYDYKTRQARFGVRPFNLAPDGQEIAGELSWFIPLPGGGNLTTNIFWRTEPGHHADVDDDIGAAIRLQFGL